MRIVLEIVDEPTPEVLASLRALLEGDGELAVQLDGEYTWCLVTAVEELPEDRLPTRTIVV